MGRSQTTHGSRVPGQAQRGTSSKIHNWPLASPEVTRSEMDGS
jgi:hypothetical protein